LGNALSNIFKTVVEHFAAGERSVIYQEIIKAKSGLQDVQHISSDLDNAASHFNWALLLSMVFCVFVVVGSIITFHHVQSCISHAKNDGLPPKPNLDAHICGSGNIRLCFLPTLCDSQHDNSRRLYLQGLQQQH
jgi:hypothetical protein